MENIWKKYNIDNKYEICVSNSYRSIIPGKENNYSINLQAYRFSKIFVSDKNYIPIEDSDKQKVRINFLKDNKKIVNLIFHYIAEIDMLNSLDVCELYKRKLYDEIQQGKWGNYLKKEFSKLNVADQDKILFWMVKKQINDKEDYFESTLNNCFENNINYFDPVSNCLLIMTSEAESEYNIKKYSLIQYLFKDLFLNNKIYWSCIPVIFDETFYKLNNNSQVVFYNLI